MNDVPRPGPEQRIGDRSIVVEDNRVEAVAEFQHHEVAQVDARALARGEAGARGDARRHGIGLYAAKQFGEIATVADLLARCAMHHE
jgi:hypothetical protein